MVKQEETICHKVDECIQDLERLVATHELDPQQFANRLHMIRKDAQKMEHAIKLRKEVMSTVEGLEEIYHKKRTGREKLKETNKIGGTEKLSKEPMQYNFQIKDLKTNEVIYNQDVRGGIVSIVEEIEDIDYTGAINGQVQNFWFGHTIVWWYAFDQIRQSLESKKAAIMAEMKQIIESGKLLDPKVKKKLLDAANFTLGK